MILFWPLMWWAWDFEEFMDPQVVESVQSSSLLTLGCFCISIASRIILGIYLCMRVYPQYAHSWLWYTPMLNIGDVFVHPTPMFFFVRPMYDKPHSQSSLYTPVHCKGILLFTGLKNWLTFLLGLNIVLINGSSSQNVTYPICYSVWFSRTNNLYLK